MFDTQLRSNCPYRFDFAVGSEIRSEAANQIPDRSGLRRDVFDRDH